MKVLDVAGTGLAKAAKAIAAPIAKVLAAPAPAGALARDADDELRRRAEINARGAQVRAGHEEAIFGSRSGWLPRRAGWLGGRR